MPLFCVVFAALSPGFHGLIDLKRDSAYDYDADLHGEYTSTNSLPFLKILIESAWHYRHRPKVSGALKRRRHGQPDWAVNIADQALARLSRRYRRLGGDTYPNGIRFLGGEERPGTDWFF